MKNHIQFLFLSHILFIIISSCSAASCYDTGNFTSNSTYANNRYQILSSLASNVSSNGGFFTTSIGLEPNKIYALGLCRGDSNTESCFGCVNSTSQELMAECPNQKEALSWGGDPECLVRYANHSFFGILKFDPSDAGYNNSDISSDFSDFAQIWDVLMDRMIDRASSGTSKLKYATGEARVNNLLFQDIYALVQCTPDLSPTDCSNCQRANIAHYQWFDSPRQGGYVFRPNCIFRWGSYRFYNASASPPPVNVNDDGSIEPGTIAAIVVPTITLFAFVVAITCIILKRRRKKRDQEVEIADEVDSAKSLQFDFATIRIATDNFSAANKLGQGGFGAVYKGKLPDGQLVAVKRLSRHSNQGEVEFKNEVLMTKLQHRNLVRLLGFCFAGNERLLIYEFVPNSSLDHFIFDQTNPTILNWEIRYRIIWGIARGLLYLHEDSRLRIIHRDLKASNILLDEEMNPKISDFGMARLFAMDQIQDNTNRVVGTFGYMAPEYVLHGHFSAKSDVYSFGVLVLEIISGRKISHSVYGEEAEDLLTYAWKNWNGGTALKLADSILSVGSRSDEMMRCINIGLLCVQENVSRRPTMASVVQMLSSSKVSLAAPLRPAFFRGTSVVSEASTSLTKTNQSKSEASITELVPR
ncbi:putative receptor-like protein kinase At4g00960 isoform X2 [Tripterygium wilfordii]|uniref:putative receptor-like protein kinase At4g00960 isoform X2 n=1 Tax=Tripterygium wilfordii TaxID=458696 RepID=UPI0018F837D1|nr:putative receptor-like protein kinase At4g00960 isoform X2 [Tripterygium wilfordii]